MVRFKFNLAFKNTKKLKQKHYLNVLDVSLNVNEQELGKTSTNGGPYQTLMLELSAKIVQLLFKALTIFGKGYKNTSVTSLW